MDIEGRSIVITPMDSSHTERLAEIETECFSTPWSYEALAEELTNPLAVFLVARCDGEIAGYVGMNQVIDEGYITNLAVTEKMRGRGIARLLLATLIDHAEQQKLSFITLEVRPTNQAAIYLYESYGFKTMGERHGFYENPVEDALIMTKNF